jgi:hypothetical protein
MLVQQRCERDFAAVFGDHAGLSYAEAKRRYYEQGPAPGWQATHISAYATMHPWEDFAETFAAYLDMVSVLDTAFHADVFAGSDPTREPLATMLDEYVRLGLVVNEMNRAMGLMDLVPEVFTTATTGKLEFVHGLVRRSAERRSRPPLAPPS